MTATAAWSYMVWMAGVMIGVGSSQENWPIFIGGSILSIIAFYALQRFGETP